MKLRQLPQISNVVLPIEKESPQPSPPPVAKQYAVQSQTDLEGSFSGCAALSENEMNTLGLDFISPSEKLLVFPSGAFVKIKLSFFGSAVSRSLIIHKNSTCTSAVMEFLSEGRFVTGETSTSPKALTIAMKMQKVFGTALSLEISGLLNAEGFCGLKNWSKSKKINMTQLPCEEGLRGNQFGTEFKSYKIDEDKRLYLIASGENQALSTELLPLPLERLDSAAIPAAIADISQILVEDQTYWVQEKTPINSRLFVAYPIGSILNFSINTLPVHGQLLLNSNGRFKYTPYTNYVGNDSFEYNVTVGKGIKTARALLQIDKAGVVTLAETCVERDAEMAANPGFIVIKPPTGLTLTSGPGTNQIIWSPNSATSYNVYWSQSTEVSKISNKITVTDPILKHTGLTSNTAYYYRVSTVYCSYESELSDVVTGSPFSEIAVQSVAMGYGFACFITTEGKVKCWGSNDYGRLGTGIVDGAGDNVDADTPQNVNLGMGLKAKSLRLNDNRACAIMEDDSLKCWGENYYGELGIGNETDQNTPQSVDFGGSKVKDVQLGKHHSCAILADDTLKCWGKNSDGTLGVADHLGRSAPVSVGNIKVKSVHLVEYTTCAILLDDSLSCWGDNSNGQFGNGTYTNSNIPVNSSLFVKSFKMGEYHSCAIIDDDELRCWGRNDGGQLGIGPSLFTYQSRPQAVLFAGETKTKSVELTDNSTCAVMVDSSAKCWGDNSNGKLGNSNEEDADTPQSVLMGTGLSTVNMKLSSNHSCAVTEGLDLYCWGYNSDGQLGIGSTDGSSTPQKVNLGIGRTVKSFEMVSSNTCAVLDNNSLKCWGENSDGQIGNGDPDYEDVLSPQEVILGLP